MVILTDVHKTWNKKHLFHLRILFNYNYWFLLLHLLVPLVTLIDSISYTYWFLYLQLLIRLATFIDSISYTYWFLSIKEVVAKQASIVIGNYYKGFVLIGCDVVLWYFVLWVVTLCFMGRNDVFYGMWRCLMVRLSYGLWLCFMGRNDVSYGMWRCLMVRLSYGLWLCVLWDVTMCLMGCDAVLGYVTLHLTGF